MKRLLQGVLLGSILCCFLSACSSEVPSHMPSQRQELTALQPIPIPVTRAGRCCPKSATTANTVLTGAGAPSAGPFGGYWTPATFCPTLPNKPRCHGGNYASSTYCQWDPTATTHCKYSQISTPTIVQSDNLMTCFPSNVNGTYPLNLSAPWTMTDYENNCVAYAQNIAQRIQNGSLPASSFGLTCSVGSTLQLTSVNYLFGSCQSRLQFTCSPGLGVPSSTWANWSIPPHNWAFQLIGACQ